MPLPSGAMAEFAGSGFADNGAAVERGTAVGVLAWFASCRHEASGRDRASVSRGSRATRRHGAVPWHDGETAQPRPPWSSYGNGSRASSSGDGGWVGRYAWASNCPDKGITALRQVLSIADSVQIRQKPATP